MQNHVDEPRKRLEELAKYIEGLNATAQRQSVIAQNDLVQARVQFDKAVAQLRIIKRIAIVIYSVWGLFLTLQIGVLVALHNQACVPQP